MRILILEDRPSDADLMEFELREAGLDFTAKRATNEQGFLQEMEAFTPDLILSDYDLPQYNGALAFTEAKKRLPGVPFILVTGCLDEDGSLRRKILADGASDFVMKDRLDRLAAAVHKAIEKGNGS